MAQCVILLELGTYFIHDPFYLFLPYFVLGPLFLESVAKLSKWVELWKAGVVWNSCLEA